MHNIFSLSNPGLRPVLDFVYVAINIRPRTGRITSKRSAEFSFNFLFLSPPLTPPSVPIHGCLKMYIPWTTTGALRSRLLATAFTLLLNVTCVVVALFSRLSCQKQKDPISQNMQSVTLLKVGSRQWMAWPILLRDFPLGLLSSPVASSNESVSKKKRILSPDSRKYESLDLSRRVERRTWIRITLAYKLTS